MKCEEIRFSVTSQIVLKMSLRNAIVSSFVASSSVFFVFWCLNSTVFTPPDSKESIERFFQNRTDAVDITHTVIHS